eukprot:CAMPEP_0182930318 /NCGR_PEP_ID=MMETSP0105_2-20130417/24702_1 /TAXON_ID=81532 ORGANISM="Acanthoeca-like sp., Strain 10tr" /NCGR_SAMPLE_ID=MMETSP0105_2 /ASSEMBLY_ACC=CAM_ASM_000205 /LENGTH=36 /DNA_ID= /DNA_START= /DNA_END= /DNA_ORIENTATION=
MRADSAVSGALECTPFGEAVRRKDGGESRRGDEVRP